MHKSLSDIQNQLRQLIAQNKLSSAIAILLECCQQSPLNELFNAVSLLSASLVELEQKKRDRLIDEREEGLQQRKITHSLLEIIDQLGILAPVNATFDLSNSSIAALESSISKHAQETERVKKNFWAWLIGGVLTLVTILAGIFQCVISLVGGEPQTGSTAKQPDSLSQVTQEKPEKPIGESLHPPSPSPSQPTNYEAKKITADSPMLSGQVQDEKGQPMAQVQVRIFDDEGRVDTALVTDSMGNFKGGIPIATHSWVRLQIKIEGYELETIKRKLPETNILIQLNKMQ